MMVSMVTTYRLNQLTGLWELMSPEFWSPNTVFAPEMPAELGLPAAPRAAPSAADHPPIVLPRCTAADKSLITGGPKHSVLEGGDGNDLVIARASADDPEIGDFIKAAVWANPRAIWTEVGHVEFPLRDCNMQPVWGYPESEATYPVWLGEHGSIYADRWNHASRDGDTLLGGFGNDTLIGNDLSNDLRGGAGADVMIGGGGEDIYWVDDAGDRVIEYGVGGRDVVYSSVSYALSDHVEKLVLAIGAGDLNGTGNALDNILIGNEGSNFLSGGTGNDWLDGAGGGDTLSGGEGSDVFSIQQYSPFGSQRETVVITDFQDGVDQIALGQWRQNNSAASLPAMRQEEGDTIITNVLGEGGMTQEIRLIGVDMQTIGLEDFLTSLAW